MSFLPPMSVSVYLTPYLFSHPFLSVGPHTPSPGLLQFPSRRRYHIAFVFMYYRFSRPSSRIFTIYAQLFLISLALQTHVHTFQMMKCDDFGSATLFHTHRASKHLSGH